jgi:LemA protein
MQLAQESLGDALRELFTAAAQDPALAADRDYVALRALWEGAEQRIATARDHYTRAVAVYNDSVGSFPTNITAGMFDFERKPGFIGRN